MARLYVLISPLHLVVTPRLISTPVWQHAAHLVLEGNGLPEPDEGEVDGVDPAPLARVPLLDDVHRLVRVGHVLVARLLPRGATLQPRLWGYAVKMAIIRRSISTEQSMHIKQFKIGCE